MRAAVDAGVCDTNAQLARVEQIKRYRILPVDWEPDSDELTPTMKLKRKPIAAKYSDEIEALYSSNDERARATASAGGRLADS
jgi:long-subunit acyl-CoA synthetase (AMP-forming)